VPHAFLDRKRMGTLVNRERHCSAPQRVEDESIKRPTVEPGPFGTPSATIGESRSF
jgi:hypothetical protein